MRAITAWARQAANCLRVGPRRYGAGMELATVKSTGDVYGAKEFSALDVAIREQLRRDLACTSCGADAYYVRPSRNGRPACFGARPHNEPCDVASQSTDSIGVESLTAVEERASNRDGFALQAADEQPIKHTTTDRRVVDQKSGRTYTEASDTGAGSTAGLKLNRLLRLLVSKPGFAESATSLSLSDGTQTTIRDYCVPMRRVDLSYRWRERVYWGTIRYANADDDGAWLNTGTRAEPTIRIKAEHLEPLLNFWELDDADDLSGAAFAFWGKLRPGKKTPDKLFLFASSLATFVTIPEEHLGS